MTRAQIADAELGAKVRAGELETGAPLPALQPALLRARCPQPDRLVHGRSGRRLGGRRRRRAGERQAVTVRHRAGGGRRAGRARGGADRRVTRPQRDGPGARPLARWLRAATAAGLPGLAASTTSWLGSRASARSSRRDHRDRRRVTAADLEAHRRSGAALHRQHGLAHARCLRVRCRSSTVAKRSTRSTGAASCRPARSSSAIAWAARSAWAWPNVWPPDRAVTLVTGDLIAGKDLALTGDLAPGNTRLQVAGRTHRQDGRGRSPTETAGVTVEDRYTGERQYAGGRLRRRRRPSGAGADPLGTRRASGSPGWATRSRRARSTRPCWRHAGRPSRWATRHELAEPVPAAVHAAPHRPASWCPTGSSSPRISPTTPRTVCPHPSTWPTTRLAHVAERA